jgi:hypothetical protein
MWRSAAALALAALVFGGCGSSSGGSASTESEAEASHARYVKICLEGREGAGGIGSFLKATCKENGVTESQPSANSPEAQRAREVDAEESAATELKEAERPVFERDARATAMVDYSEGKASQARTELEKGCPKASAEELDEAWNALQHIAGTSAHEIEAELEVICPL